MKTFLWGLVACVMAGNALAADVPMQSIILIPRASPPASPWNGQCWILTAGGLYCHYNGITVGPYVAAGASGTVSSVDGTSTTGTLIPTGGPITSAGSLNYELNLAHANTWPGQQSFVAPVLGTPASGNAANLTGTAIGMTAGQATAANGLKTATTTVAINAATAPTAGQVLTATSPSSADWESLAGIGTVTTVAGTSAGGTLIPTGGPITSAGSLNYELNLAHANTWPGQQSFVAPILGTPASGNAANLTGTAAGLTAGQATAANGLKTATTTVAISSATAPVAGQVLTATSGSTADWEALAGIGTVTTVAGTSVSGTLIPTGGPITSAGSLNYELNLAHANTWPGQQTFVAPVLGTPASGNAANLTGTAAGLTAGQATAANGLKTATTTVAINAAAAPTAGQVMTATGGSTAAWADLPPSVSVTAATPNVVVTPSPGTGTFTIGTTNPLNTQSGSSYTIVSGDLAKTVIRSAAGAQTDTVPQATGSFAAGATFDLQTLTNGDTLTPTTSTANGLTSIKLGARQFSEWSSNGANWNVFLGLPQPATQTGTTVLYDDMVWRSLASTRTAASPTVTVSDMNGTIWISSGGLTIPVISAGLFDNKQTLYVVNYGGGAAVVTNSSGQTINSGGGCVAATGVPAGGFWQLQPNGTSIDCAQGINATGSVAISTGVTGLGTGVATAAAVNLSAAGGLTTTIARGAQAMSTSAIASAACSTVITVSAPNVATTDIVDVGFNGSPIAVTGFVPLVAGMLAIAAYPTAGNINIQECNNTTSSITPGAHTLNWSVKR